MEDRGLGKGFYSFFLAFCRFHTPKGKDCVTNLRIIVTESQDLLTQNKKMRKSFGATPRKNYIRKQIKTK